MTRKTTTGPLRPEPVWHSKSGAQFANRNALKTGADIAAVLALRSRIADWHRRVKAILAQVDPAPAPHRRSRPGPQPCRKAESAAPEGPRLAKP